MMRALIFVLSVLPVMANAGWAIKAQWDKVPNATEYRLQWWIGNGVKKTKSTRDTAAQIKLPDTVVGKPVHARVRACVNKLCSDWSDTANTIVIPPAPKIRVELLWQAP